MAKYIPVHLKSNTRIIVLCNNEIALPALQQLFISGSLKAVVVPEKNSQLYSLLHGALACSGIPLIKVNRKNLDLTTSDLIIQHNITAVWLMTFAYILPKALLDVLPGGFINFHYGLLPKYRGANPVLSQMLNFETEGGITVHQLDSGIDSGPVVIQTRMPIADNDTFGMQLQKLSILGASLVPGLLDMYVSNNILPSQPQDESLATYFKKPTAADLMIRWQTMSAKQVSRLINACNPWNKGAGALINGQVFCLTEAGITGEPAIKDTSPGTVVGLDEQNGLKISTADGQLIRVNVFYTPEGFFPGHKIGRYGVKINDRFTS